MRISFPASFAKGELRSSCKGRRCLQRDLKWFIWFQTQFNQKKHLNFQKHEGISGKVIPYLKAHQEYLSNHKGKVINSTKLLPISRVTSVSFIIIRKVANRGKFTKPERFYVLRY